MYDMRSMCIDVEEEVERDKRFDISWKKSIHMNSFPFPFLSFHQNRLLKPLWASNHSSTQYFLYLNQIQAAEKKTCQSLFIPIFKLFSIPDTCRSQHSVCCCLQEFCCFVGKKKCAEKHFFRQKSDCGPPCSCVPLHAPTHAEDERLILSRWFVFF